MRAETYLLGIDVGTTGTKTWLFRSDGKPIAHAYRAYETRVPQVGYSEQDPLDWWNAVVQTVREVCREPNIAEAVAGIALSVQGGTMVPVDKNFEPVKAAVVWNDSRCKQEYDAFLEEVGPAETMYFKTGWEMEHGLNALQIRWMREHEPEYFSKTAMFLSVPDYLAYKMTGIPALDLSNAGINQLAHIVRGRYDPQLLAFCGITEAQLPRILQAGEVIGFLTDSAAAELGLPSRVKLCVGAHDQYAVALGAGACEAGDILIGSGTCWVLTSIGNRPDFSSGLSQSVAAVPGKWGSICSLSSGGVCLDWWRKKMAGLTEELSLSYEEINQQVPCRKAAEDGLFFYPFTGQGTENKIFSRATLVGLALSHDRYHIARAIMEGIAFQIVWMLEKFHCPPSSEGLILAGGASKSDFWCQLVADISGLPVRIPEVADLACVGAAVLAGTGCGIYPDAQTGSKCLNIGQRTVYPRPERVRIYRECLEEYRKNAKKLGEMYCI